MTNSDADLANDEILDARIMSGVTASQHISCTCKMGPLSDAMAVAEQYGKVHGLAGPQFSDASIMPDCIQANTIVTPGMMV